MTREEVFSRLYDRFISPTEQKKESYIGVEIEMPIVNLNNKAVDFAVVHKLTAAFLKEFDFAATAMALRFICTIIARRSIFRQTVKSLTRIIYHF